MKIQGVQLIRRKPKDAVSVLRIDNYYLLTATSAVPSADNQGWTLVSEGGTAPVPISAYPYLWHKTVTVMSDGTSTTVIGFGGSLGQNGFDYDLVPTASSILKDADGNVSPDSVGCALIRREADGTVTHLATAPTGYAVKFSLDNSAERNFGTGDKVLVDEDNTVVTFLLYYGDVVVERQNIYVISEGAQGLNGRGIQSQDYGFKATAENTAPDTPADSSGFSSNWYALESAGYSTEKPYLWRCTKTTYIDGNNKTTTEYAVDGPTVWGEKGDTGNGIASEVKLYTMTVNETEPADTTTWATWNSLYPFINPARPYIWECTKTTYTDGTVAKLGKHIIGKNVDYIDKATQYALGDSGTEAPTSGWASTYTPTDGKWVWERTEYCWPKAAHTYSDAVCKGYFAKNGTNGVAGMIMRVTEWQADTEYHNDEALETSPRYLDIVTVTDSATGNFSAYQCKKSHTSSSSLTPTNGTYWTEMNSLSPIYTSLIVADKAVMRLSQTNQINIVNSQNKVQGSFGGVEDETNGYPLWMGGETASAAKFKVKYDGTLEATGANITGTVNATAGTFKDVTIEGSIRSPFKPLKTLYAEQNTNNLYAVNSSGLIYPASLPWTIEASGRRMCISGGVEISAPTGKYFFMDGRKVTTLQTLASEIVELLGYGVNNEFLGWIVLNRKNRETSYGYGIGLQALAHGRIVISATKATLDQYQTWDDSELSVTLVSTGVCRLTFSSSWFAANTDMRMQLTGCYNGGDNSYPCYAGMMDMGTGWAKIGLMYSDQMTTGAFSFIIYNAKQWFQSSMVVSG